MYLDFLLISVGWCSTRMSSDYWIQVDFKHTMDIYGLVVQKHSTINGYMATLAISYSDDEEKWTYITKEDGIKRLVSGVSKDCIFAHANVCQYS